MTCDAAVGCCWGAPPGAPAPVGTAPASHSDAQCTGQRRLQAAQAELQLPASGLGPGQLCLGGCQAALGLAELQARQGEGVLGCLGPQGQVPGLILELLLTAPGILKLGRQLPLTSPPA